MGQGRLPCLLSFPSKVRSKLSIQGLWEGYCRIVPSGVPKGPRRSCLFIIHLCVTRVTLMYSGIHPQVSILNQKNGWVRNTDAAKEEDTSPLSAHLGSVFPSCSDSFFIYISNCLLEECTLLVSCHHLIFTQPKIYLSIHPVLQIRCSLNLTLPFSQDWAFQTSFGPCLFLATVISPS